MKRAARKPHRAAKAQEAAPVFAALGDPTRLRLVSRLCEQGPMSIARLTEGESVTRQAVTKHLRALEEAGLVRGSRRGRESTWELRTARLQEVRRYLERVAAQWDSALARLQALVEDDAPARRHSAGRKPSTER